MRHESKANEMTRSISHTMSVISDLYMLSGHYRNMQAQFTVRYHHEIWGIYLLVCLA